MQLATGPLLNCSSRLRARHTSSPTAGECVSLSVLNSIQKDVDARPLRQAAGRGGRAAPARGPRPGRERRSSRASTSACSRGWSPTDRLEIRVGVPQDRDGRLLTHKESGRYFHTKYGIFTDRYGNKVAFNGSNNASVTAWVKNHETFDAYPSWNAPIWEYIGVDKVRDFEKHWNDNPDAGWAVIDLPSAVKQHLIEHAPDCAAQAPSSRTQPGRQSTGG